jgi:hypothetical protein
LAAFGPTRRLAQRKKPGDFGRSPGVKFIHENRVEAAIMRAAFAGAMGSPSVPEPRCPISLTDQQMDALMNAAAPLPSPQDRSAFLHAVSSYFVGRSEIGDGELHRCIVELQRIYFRAPSGREVVHGAPKQLARMGRPVGSVSNR